MRITSLYAAPLALLFIALSLRVILARRTRRIGFGSNDDDLLRRIRVHANFAEYVPFALILIAMAEWRGAPPVAIHALGLMLVVGRLVHAVGVSRPSTDEIGRIGGMSGSLTVVLVAAVLIVMA